MNYALKQLRQQRNVMNVWAKVGAFFIVIWGGFTVFGLNSGIQLSLTHPVPIFAFIFILLWSFFGVMFMQFCASRK